MSPVPSIRLTICLAAAFILVSCSAPPNTAAPVAPGGPVATSAPASPAASSGLLAEPHPLDITVTLDNDRAVRELIPVSGGTLEATGSDGSVFTLVIPENALLTTEYVTMTPISQMDNLPFSGPAAAVQLEPEGLRLWAPAILTIRPAFAPPAGEEAGFAYHMLGMEFHLFPLLPDLHTIAMPIIHFSGYGLAQGTPTQTSVPTAVEDQLSQQVSTKLSQARREALLNGGGSGTVDLGPEFRQYFDQVIKPILEAARTDCEAAKKGMPRALGWVRQIQLLGSGEAIAAETDEVMRTRVDALANCYNKAYDKCVMEDDLNQATEMLSALRALVLIGADSAVDEGKITKCLTFELRFNSRFESTPPAFHGLGSAAGMLVQHVVATVKFSLSLVGAVNLGSGPLDFIEFHAAHIPAGMPCVIEENAIGSVFNLVKASIPLDVMDGGSGDITLIIEPGTTGESARISCPPAPGVDMIPPAPRWHETFQIHHPEEDLGDGLYLIRDWDVSGGKPYATKLFDFRASNVYNTQGGEYTEQTTLELIHAPEP